jgi:hypothetical protein
MLSQHRLPLVFDPVRLQRDLALVRADEWVAHFNKQDYDGAWSGVSLRGVGGIAAGIYTAPLAPLETFADTPVLVRCPYLAEVLRQFHCPLRSVRLLRLCPGSVIREHRDDRLGLEDGEARIHVPISTNPSVAFFVNGERLTMNPGETWYIDFSLPHRVSNLGETDRVHLVIDCVVNDWLRGMLPPDATEPEAVPVEAPSSPVALQRFRAIVEQDESLQEELRDILDHVLFVSRVVQLGASRGCRFASADVEEALRGEKRAWLERRVTW